MSDDARRAAERRWRETGHADDGRRFLAQLVRAGEDEARVLQVRLSLRDLHEERAVLAAHLGHAPARAALGARAPSDEGSTLVDWGKRLFDFGQPACVRAALAASRLVLRVIPGAEIDADADPRRALDAAEAWLTCPCPRHYAAAEAWNPLRGRLAEWAWQTVTAAHCPPRVCGHHVEAIRSAAATDVGAERVRAAIREALLPWALSATGGDQSLERPTCSRT